MQNNVGVSDLCAADALVRFFCISLLLQDVAELIGYWDLSRQPLYSSLDGVFKRRHLDRKLLSVLINCFGETDRAFSAIGHAAAIDLCRVGKPPRSFQKSPYSSPKFI